MDDNNEFIERRKEQLWAEVSAVSRAIDFAVHTGAALEALLVRYDRLTDLLRELIAPGTPRPAPILR